MVQLDLVSRTATAASAAHERAAGPIALPHLPANRHRHVPAPRRRLRRRDLPAGAQSPPLDLGQRCAHALMEHLLQPAARQLVRQRLSNRLEVGHEIGAHSHPEHMSLGRYRLQPRRGPRLRPDRCGRRCRRCRCRRRSHQARYQGRRQRRLDGAGDGRFRPGTTTIIPKAWELPQQVCGGRPGAKRGHQHLDLLLSSPCGPIQDLGEPEGIGAERKKRRVTLRHHRLPAIQLGQVTEELDQQAPLSLGLA
jgi:hypothetical protein